MPKLEVIEARDIKRVPQNPAIYVRLALSGNKLSKTGIKRNPAPAWEHTCSLYVLVLRSRAISSKARALRTAELSSVVSLHLKHSREWFGPILLGSVDVSTEDLLDRCKNDQRELTIS